MIVLANKIDFFDGICSYSGADIGVVCREALLRPIRRLGSATHFKRVRNDHRIHIPSNLELLFRYLIQNQEVHKTFGLPVHLVILKLKK